MQNNTNRPILHVVHCIDTEGPLDEDIAATFARLESIFGITLAPSNQTLAALQRQEIPLGGLEPQVSAVLAPALLAYNRTWRDVESMLKDALSPAFRTRVLDSVGQGWVYSWHCLDHLGYEENPRKKALGYGQVFQFYKKMLEHSGSSRDEINWHFHPLSLTRRPLAAATSFNNSMDVLLQVIARRILDDQWFPTTNRPGFHAERPDSHLFLEQWIPFDFANQACDDTLDGQKDIQMGRFGDWRRATADWIGYHPHHDDYQKPGQCRRWIFRCLNVGTRLRCLTENDVRKAFEDATTHGSAILAFADHDYRDIRPDVDQVQQLIGSVAPDYPDVALHFSGAEEAAQQHVCRLENRAPHSPPRFTLQLDGNRLHVRLTDGSVFGPQPFLAILDKTGNYHHDNLDIIEPSNHWTYVFDEQTLPIDLLSSVGVGAAGIDGGFGTARLQTSLDT